MTGIPLFTGRLPNGADIRVLTGDQITDQDARRMVEVLQAAFDRRWPACELAVAPIDHLRWKLEGPSEPASYVMLIERDGRLASMQVNMHTPVLVRGRRLEFGIGGDACTHPDFERQGMYSQRRDSKTDTIEPLLSGSLGFSLNPTVLRARQRRRPRTGGRPPANAPRVLLRVYDARRLAADRHEAGARAPQVALATAFAALQAASAATARLPRRGAEDGDWDVADVDRFDSSFDDLAAAAASRFDFILERSAHYLNWRYRDPRGGTYRTVAAMQNGRALGYVVFKTQRARGYVVDLLVRPGRLEVARSLVRRADEAFRAEGVSGAVCWLPRFHPYRPVLRRTGFFDSRQPTGSNMRTYATEPSDTLDFIDSPRAHLHMTLGDTDWA